MNLIELEKSTGLEEKNGGHGRNPRFATFSPQGRKSARVTSLSLFHLRWFLRSTTTFAFLLLSSFPFVPSSTTILSRSFLLFLPFLLCFPISLPLFFYHYHSLSSFSIRLAEGTYHRCVLRVWMSMTATVRVFIGGDSAALVGAKILTFGLVEVGPSARSEIPDTDSPNWDSNSPRPQIWANHDTPIHLLRELNHLSRRRVYRGEDNPRINVIDVSWINFNSNDEGIFSILHNLFLY